MVAILLRSRRGCSNKSALPARLAAVVFWLACAAGAGAQTPLPAAHERLFAAIDQGKELVAEGLIARDAAAVNARNAARETPLHLAIEKNMKGLAGLLVRSGADLRARTSNGETVLHFAALHSDHFFVDLLLSAGADPKARNDDGESVLMWAALSGNATTAQRLLNDGADPNVADLKGNLPLHGAADGGYLDVVKLLLPGTARPGARNREGLSARAYARRRGHPEIDELLERFDDSR